MIFETFFVFVFGTAIGSFLNVVILRSQEGKTLGGRSQCPHCHHQLTTADLIPLISYLFLKGKCRYCKQKLSVQYPLVELLTAFSFTLIFLFFSTLSDIGTQTPTSELLNMFFSFFVVSVLIVISVSDLRWGIIPDKVILPASLVALLYQIATFLLAVFGFKNFQFPVFNFYSNFNNSLEILNFKLEIVTFLPFVANLATAVLIGLFFFLLIVGTRGRGMGGGDLKLSIFIGLTLGWPLAVLAIFLGFLTGALSAVMLILLGRKSLKQTVPFGPFLALGSFLSMLYGKEILELYLKSMGLQ